MERGRYLRRDDTDRHTITICRGRPAGRPKLITAIAGHLACWLSLDRTRRQSGDDLSLEEHIHDEWWNGDDDHIRKK